MPLFLIQHTLSQMVEAKDEAEATLLADKTAPDNLLGGGTLTTAVIPVAEIPTVKG